MFDAISNVQLLFMQQNIFQKKRGSTDFHLSHRGSCSRSGSTRATSGWIEPWTQHSIIGVNSVEHWAQLPFVASPTGKCPEKWAGFALKHEHLPPIVSNCDLSDVRMAPGADHGIRW